MSASVSVGDIFEDTDSVAGLRTLIVTRLPAHDGGYVWTRRVGAQQDWPTTTVHYLLSGRYRRITTTEGTTP